jgi:ferredoxin-NADP reductase/Na+-translocating ferredoxin:NAD+ oxidoreductase RnfD subunit
MYQLLLYGLLFLSGLSILFGFVGILPFSGWQFLLTFTVIYSTAYISKKLFQKLFKSFTNHESSYITAYILFLVLAPIASFSDLWITIAITVAAIASKYIFAIDKKHLFNPVAIAVFLAGLLGFGNGIWWVGSLVLLPFVVIGGLLVVRKIRKFYLLGAFLLTAIPTIILFNLQYGMSVLDSLQQMLGSWPLIFFGTIMLTEPLTMPTRKKWYIPFGMIVGVLFGSQFYFGPIHASPELALVIGNIFAYIVSPRYKLYLLFKDKVKIAPNIYEFIFEKKSSFNFLPGQYLEWTLPEKGVDSRGNRRYFTIASSPTEKDVLLGVRIDEKASSSFKKVLLSMKKGDIVVASQLAGDFVLHTQEKSVVFIAGGIGITPFRSMIEYLSQQTVRKNIVLFYTASSPEELVYMDTFQKAQKQGWLTVVPVVTKEENVPQIWNGEKGHLTTEIIQKYSNSKADKYYISGPNAMVEAYMLLLHDMGIKRNKIVTDYFPGF